MSNSSINISFKTAKSSIIESNKNSNYKNNLHIKINIINKMKIQ